MSAVIITVDLEILIMYIFGVLYENDRRSYKVVLFEKEKGEDSKYIFKDQNGQMNYEIYPIIFEDNDSYILARLYIEDGKIEIDYKYQRVIEKTDVEIFNFDNIYSINIGK
ncbi:MAG: hypothetical protein IJA34_13150 [Lachnospiraceae bacterium]|nr:hypothetical protein [Lachnospiraceae bacterium]